MTLADLKKGNKFVFVNYMNPAYNGVVLEVAEDPEEDVQMVDVLTKDGVVSLMAGFEVKTMFDMATVGTHVV